MTKAELSVVGAPEVLTDILVVSQILLVAGSLVVHEIRADVWVMFVADTPEIDGAVVSDERVLNINSAEVVALSAVSVAVIV